METGLRFTSSLGFFFSLSPSTRTRTTPDLSTISWMTLPFLPITFPVQQTESQKDWAHVQVSRLLRTHTFSLFVVLSRPPRQSQPGFKRWDGVERQQPQMDLFFPSPDFFRCPSSAQFPLMSHYKKHLQRNGLSHFVLLGL